jgi:hypothetical protein
MPALKEELRALRFPLKTMGFAAAGAGTGKSPKMEDIADMMFKVFLGRFSLLGEGRCAYRSA